MSTEMSLSEMSEIDPQKMQHSYTMPSAHLCKLHLTAKLALYENTGASSYHACTGGTLDWEATARKQVQLWWLVRHTVSTLIWSQFSAVSVISAGNQRPLTSNAYGAGRRSNAMRVCELRTIRRSLLPKSWTQRRLLGNISVHGRWLSGYPPATGLRARPS